MSCKRLLHVFSSTGLRLNKGAGHKFDSDDTSRIKVANAVTTQANCPYEFDVETFTVLDRTNGQKLQGPEIQAAFKKCGSRGASVEGNTAARNTAAKAAVTFLRSVRWLVQLHNNLPASQRDAGVFQPAAQIRFKFFGSRVLEYARERARHIADTSEMIPFLQS